MEICLSFVFLCNFLFSLVFEVHYFIWSLISLGSRKMYPMVVVYLKDACGGFLEIFAAYPAYMHITSQILSQTVLEACGFDFLIMILCWLK